MEQQASGYKPSAAAVQSLTEDINQFLVASEWHLIEFMVNNKKWSGFVTPPSGWETQGSIETGIFLFLLNHPECAKGDALKAINFLKSIFVFEPSKIDKKQYKELDHIKNYLVYHDGSLLSTALFCNYDQNWITTIYNLYVTFTEGIFYNDRNLPVPDTTPYKLTPVNGSSSLTVCMAGDAGSGTESDLVHAMSSLNPDCMIHLVDVYYAGTPQVTPPKSSKPYILSGEEINNLVNIWPQKCINFTLNSNHEMYSGANGLFNDALTSAVFNHQGQNSIFAITVADWTILGLDSAFFAEMSNLFMFGRFNGSILDHTFNHDEQINWIKGLLKDNPNITPDKTIILTHHNAFDYACDNSALFKEEYHDNFWKVLSGALGGDPYAWYWGHVHNAIVYCKPLTIDYPNEPFKTNTYCRCLGNGSLPYGTATALLNDPDKDLKYKWFAGCESDKVQTLPNGFVSLTFQIQDDKVTAISENFYLGTENSFTGQLYKGT